MISYQINARVTRGPDSTVNAPVTTGGGDNFNWLPMCSRHPGGCNFLIADGSVRFFSESTDITTLRGLATINGGEVVSLPAY